MRWLLAGLLLVCNFPTHAVADDPQDPCNDIWEACEIAEDHPESDIIQRDVNGQLIWVAVARLSPRVGQSNRRALTAVDRPSTPFSLKTSNSGFGTEAGESNPQGVMKRTVWRRFAVDEPSRVVIHTYGSEVDTALAVYTGSRLNALTRIAFNDDAPVTGGEATSSLVSFDAEAGRTYSVQLGSKSGAEGNVRMDVFALPRAGGITAFLVDGIPAGTFPGADWVCALGSGGLSSCPSPVFLLHNATDRTVTVKADTPLGQGSIPPADFTLKPGKSVLKSFTFDGSFDKTALRTISGVFKFTAMAGGNTVGNAKLPAVLTVFGSDTAGVDLKLRSVPLIESAAIGGPGAFPLEIANEGTVKAAGCQFSQLFDASFRVTWHRYSAAKQALLSQLNPVFDVEPGQRLPFVVGLTSDVARLSGGNNTVRVQCTNADKFTPQIADAYRFDLTTLQSFKSHLMPLPDLKGDVLNVPVAGRVYELAIANDGSAAKLKLSADVLAPTSDASNARFTAFVCPMNATTAQCLNSTATTQTIDAPKGKTFKVKVAVRRPASDPGFDPERRRLVVTLKETLGFFGSLTAAQHSIALQYR
mgnify:CR=1 FL=1